MSEKDDIYENKAHGDVFRRKHSPPLEVCLDKKCRTQDFDEIIVGRFTRISFHRTLRIPEDGRDYPLPASLGRFPIHRVEDYAERVPLDWLEEGGFFLPLYQKEALFLQFEGPNWHPTIAKVCVGKINAITAKPYSEEISNNHQDYIVVPKQKWLDGICSGAGLVKQFVAMPLGQGYTIEAQLTDEEKFGGFQIVIMDAIEGRFPNRDPAIDSRIESEEETRRRNRSGALFASELPDRVSFSLGSSPAPVSMGIAAGGSIKQQILKDTYGVESWKPSKRRGLTIHLVNSIAYKAITGYEPPPSPITVTEYERAKIPWYSHYDETTPAIKPPSIFKRVLGISAIEKKREISQPDEQFKRYMAILNIHKIRTPDKYEASKSHRERARENLSKEWWVTAAREISHVIDLQADVRAEDYILRSCCNFHLARFKDGVIDASLALEKDQESVEAISWRAYCRKSLGDYGGLAEDANRLISITETKMIGFELRAEVALNSEDYCEAYNDAMTVVVNCPGHIRAEEICRVSHMKLFGNDDWR